LSAFVKSFFPGAANPEETLPFFAPLVKTAGQNLPGPKPMIDPCKTIGYDKSCHKTSEKMTF
jgi:hypothetical protein